MRTISDLQHVANKPSKVRAEFEYKLPVISSSYFLQCSLIMHMVNFIILLQHPHLQPSCAI